VLIAAVALIIVVVVPLVGGRISNLGRLRLRWMWLIFAALAIQFVILAVLDDAPTAVLKSVHIATYAAILVFLIANRRVPWMWAVALGALSNWIVISANAGVMPQSRSAQRTAGLDPTSGFANSQVLDHPRLRFLGDVFATPSWMPLANVFSIGDIILFVGLIPMIITISRVPAAETRSYLLPLDGDDGDDGDDGTDDGEDMQVTG